MFRSVGSKMLTNTLIQLICLLHFRMLPYNPVAARSGVRGLDVLGAYLAYAV